MGDLCRERLSRRVSSRVGSSAGRGSRFVSVSPARCKPNHCRAAPLDGTPRMGKARRAGMRLFGGFRADSGQLKLAGCLYQAPTVLFTLKISSLEPMPWANPLVNLSIRLGQFSSYRHRQAKAKSLWSGRWFQKPIPRPSESR